MPVSLIGALLIGALGLKMTKRFAHLTRREFLQKSGMFVAGMAASQINPHRTGIIARPLLDVNALERFVDPLPLPPILKPSGTRPSPDAPAAQIPYYRVEMRALESKVHRDVKPTRLWGFGDNSPGPTFETRSGEPLLVEWANELPAAHFLPIDHSVHGAEADKPECSGRHPPAWRESSRPERRLSGRLVGPGQIGALLLPQSSGRGHAVVSRPRVGNYPPEYVCRTLWRLRHSRCSLKTT